MNAYARYFRKTQIEPAVPQQCVQANFNGTKLRCTLIPVPPMAEQERIVAKVSELLSLCNDLESKLNLALRGSDALFSSVLNLALNQPDFAAQ